MEKSEEDEVRFIIPITHDKEGKEKELPKEAYWSFCHTEDGWQEWIVSKDGARPRGRR